MINMEARWGITTPDNSHWQELSEEELNSLQEGDPVLIKLTQEIRLFTFDHWYEEFQKFPEKELCICHSLEGGVKSVAWFIAKTRIGKYNLDRDMIVLEEGTYET
jgi:hypothetical protein